MSKYQDCAIFVDGNGRYCCRPKVMRVGQCPWVIMNANGGDIPILMYPTGNVNDTPVDSGLVASEGVTILDTSGVFKLDIDCEALDGTDAPTDGAAITVCCEPNTAQNLDSIQTQKLCDIADALGGDLTIAGPIDVTGTVSIEGPVEVTGTVSIDGPVTVEGEVSIDGPVEIDGEVDIAGWDTAQACWDQIKANTAGIVGMETSLAQVGCTYEDNDETLPITGHVLVCKVTKPGEDPVYEKHLFGLDGTVTSPYDGPYKACTNLSQLASLLEQILKKTTATPRIWGTRKDCNWADNQRDGENFSGLMLSQDEHDLVITLSDGSVCTGTIPGTVPQDYDVQLAAYIALLKSCTGNKDWEVQSAPRDGDLATPLARHAKVICCPGDIYVTGVVATVVGGKRAGRVLPLLAGYDKGEVEKLKEYDCGPDAPSIWETFDGKPATAPEDMSCWFLNCAFPADKAHAPEAVPCPIKTYGPLSDCDTSTEPPTTIATDIYLDVENCDGVVTQILHNYPNGPDQPYEIYEPQGEILNADKSAFDPEIPTVPKTLDDLAGTKNAGIPGADYDSVVQWVFGRPAWGEPFTLYNANGQVVIEGDNGNDFTANAKALGYSVWDFGEFHYICPCPSGGPFKIEAATGTTETDCIPRAKVPSAPTKAELLECYLRVRNCGPISVLDRCFSALGEQKKVAYQVGDFDPGDLKPGDGTSVDFEITVPDGCTITEVTVPTAPAGAQVVAGAPGQYKLEWNYEGTNSPSWPICATLVAADGSTAVLKGSDFEIASGGGETQSVAFTKLLRVKELCFEGKPSVFQDSTGAVVDVSGLAVCPDPTDPNTALLQSILDKPTCQMITLYQIDKVEGVVEQKWTDSAIATSAAQGSEYLLAFNETDSEGYPAHPNPPDSTAPGTKVGTSSVNTGAADHAQSDFWLCPPEPVTLQEFEGTAEAVGVWMSKGCDGVMTQRLSGPYTNTQVNHIGRVDGIVRMRAYHDDWSANGSVGIWYLDPATGERKRVPLSWTSQIAPRVTPICAWICDDGKIWNQDKTKELTLSDTLVKRNPCPSSCGGSDYGVWGGC